MRKSLIFKSLSVIVFIILVVFLYYSTDCRTREEFITVDTMNILTKRVEALRPKMGKAVDVYHERAEVALAKWQNKVVDPEPILIYALLERPSGLEQVFLRFMTFDEDLDLAGFGINEHHTCADGSTKEFMEQYPVFVNRPGFFYGADIHIIPIHIRDADQHKPEQKWQEYLDGEGIDLNRMKSGEYWRNTLPEIWISIPEPNDVEVEVYIYDRAGHKSQPVKLECFSDLFVPDEQTP